MTSWDGDSLTVWCSTQGIFPVRDDLALHFVLPHQNVRVITQYLGGGFGSKLGVKAETVIAAGLAREAGAPIKVMATREGEHLATGNRRQSIRKVRVGARRDGRLSAVELVQHGSGAIGGGSGSAGRFFRSIGRPTSEPKRPTSL